MCQVTVSVGLLVQNGEMLVVGGGLSLLILLLLFLFNQHTFLEYWACMHDMVLVYADTSSYVRTSKSAGDTCTHWQSFCLGFSLSYILVCKISLCSQSVGTITA